MKIIYTTDAHVTLQQPKNRTDDYVLAWQSKLKWILQYAEENPEVQKWFDGGDFFHSATHSCELAIAAASVFKNAKNILPIIMEVGNHPVKGNYERSMEKSALTVLQDMGIVKYFQGPKIVTAGKRKFLFWHTTIVEKPTPWEHHTFEDVAKKFAGKVDFVLCSHYHAYQGHKVINGVHFIAPGSLTRGMGNEVDLSRKPLLAVIDTDTMEVEFVPVPCSQYPFKETAVVKEEDSTGAICTLIREKLGEIQHNKLDFIKLLDVLLTEEKITQAVHAYLSEMEKEVVDAA